MKQAKLIICLELIKKVYNYSLCGGNAHIVFDDNNIENEHIDFCLDYVNSDTESPQEQLKAEKDALEYFRALTKKERNIVVDTKYK